MHTFAYLAMVIAIIQLTIYTCCTLNTVVQSQLFEYNCIAAKLLKFYCLYISSFKQVIANYPHLNNHLFLIIFYIGNCISVTI